MLPFPAADSRPAGAGERLGLRSCPNNRYAAPANLLSRPLMTNPDNPDHLDNRDRLETFWAGQPIFMEGTPGKIMFVVMEGWVRLKVRGNPVEEIGPGGIFGEMALVDGSPRSATAEAITHCTLATISEERFNALVQTTPGFALRVMRVLALRLRNMDTLL